MLLVFYWLNELFLGIHTHRNEIKNYNELNEYTIYRNLYSIAKAVLRGKFILLNASITEGGTLVSQKLEEEE